MHRFDFRPFLAPGESLLLHLTLYPNRIGTSRLYITFTSDEIASLIQTVPIEIVREPIKIPSKVETTEAKKEEQEQPLTKALSSSTSTLDPNKQDKHEDTPAKHSIDLTNKETTSSDSPSST